MEFRPPNLLKGILLLKVFIVVGILFHFSDLITVGEKLSKAQEAPPAEEYQEAERKVVKSKTFLDKLFDLPEIDENSVEKAEVGRYMSLLEKKKQEIESRLNFLQEREAKLMQIEQLVEDKLQKLDEEKKFIAETLQQEKLRSQERVDQLVEFYKKMNAKKAAPVFEQLDKDLVVQLFNQLPQKQIMSILEMMSPEKSVELTEYFGRVRSGREYDLLKEMNTSLRAEFADCKAH